MSGFGMYMYFVVACFFPAAFNSHTCIHPAVFFFFYRKVQVLTLFLGTCSKGGRVQMLHGSGQMQGTNGGSGERWRMYHSASWFPERLFGPMGFANCWHRAQNKKKEVVHDYVGSRR